MEVIYWNHKTEKFIKDLDPVASMHVDKTVEVLEKFGHLIEMPDSKSLGKGLFELRVHRKIHIRLLYVYKNGKAYIVHGFIKKAWKIPLADMEYGRRMQKEVMRFA